MLRNFLKKRISLIFKKNRIEKKKQKKMGCKNKCRDFVDLGLPSGTSWAKENMKGYKSFYKAVSNTYGSVPSIDQFKELLECCIWNWNGNGFHVVGPNGNYIVFPAKGFIGSYGDVLRVGEWGFYWTDTPKDKESAWRLSFTETKILINCLPKHIGISVRLVDKHWSNLER